MQERKIHVAAAKARGFKHLVNLRHRYGDIGTDQCFKPIPGNPLIKIENTPVCAIKTSKRDLRILVIRTRRRGFDCAPENATS